MAKYLVTGGEGFIGANLIKELVRQKHEVFSLDNNAAGVFKERLIPGVKYLKGDIRKKSDIEKACKNKIDGIFHLAALPRVLFSVENPEIAHDVNVNGTFNVLMAAKENGIGKVIFVTSSASYGDQEVFPVREDGVVKKPVSPYGLHKLIGEEYCRLFSELYGLKTVSLCLFNVYGPMFDPNGAYALVIGKFLSQKINGEPMTVRGDGEMYRDYTHVNDVVDALCLAMDKDTVGRGEVINIGFGDPHSVNELVDLIGGEHVNVPELSGEMKFTKADNSKAKELLGWVPKIDLKSGIKMLKDELGIK